MTEFIIVDKHLKNIMVKHIMANHIMAKHIMDVEGNRSTLQWKKDLTVYANDR